MKRLCLPAAMIAVVCVMCLVGCHKSVEPASAPPTPAVRGSATAPVADVPRTPIKDSITQLISAHSPGDPFPGGTRLLSASLDGGVVSLDFSREFSSLADSGESNESNAQKALRSTLAKFDNVQKMRVTVEGKPFPSQATDWSTPFPVRDDTKAPVRDGRQ